MKPDGLPALGGGSVSSGDRALLMLAGLAALVAVLTRVHNAFAYPALWDFDAPGHVLNMFALREGVLPDPRSWSGFHPPLYHALGALTWALLPERVPVHAALRLLSAAAGFAAVAVTWRVIGQFVSRVDAAVVGALLLGVPALAMATSMLGNETTCMLFVTLVLARTISTPERAEEGPRHAWGTAFWVFFALLSKATGFLAVAVSSANYLLRYRTRPRSAIVCVAIAGALPTLLAAPIYLRVISSAGGDAFASVLTTGMSPDLRAMAARQPPGERKLGDYVYLPAATFLAPTYRAEGMTRSVPGLLYASTWADAHSQFLQPLTRSVLLAETALAISGLLPTAIGMYGICCCARRRDVRLFAPMALGALLVVGQFHYAWIVPHYSVVKASYFLSATIAAALALALGLDALRGRWRQGVRIAFVVLSLSGSALTWYACWY